MIGEGTLFLFGVSRAHEWQVRELVREGYTVYGWHSGGPDFAPWGLNVAQIGGPYRFSQVPDVFFLNESHFDAAKAFSTKIGGKFRAWSGEQNNKFFQREALSDLMPVDFQFGRLRVLLDWLEGQRMVVKPSVQTGGSNGVKIFPHTARVEAIQHFRELSLAGLEPIVESEILGAEYCVDGYVEEGEVRWLSVGEYFSEPAETLPAGILFGGVERQLTEIFHSITVQILSRFGYSEGPFHIEYRSSLLGTFPIEVHGRFGGAIVTEALQRLAGVSPFVRRAEPVPCRTTNRIIWLEFFYPGTSFSRQAEHFLYETTRCGSLTAFPRLAKGSQGNKRVGYLTVEGNSITEVKASRADLLHSAGVHPGHPDLVANLLEGIRFRDNPGGFPY